MRKSTPIRKKLAPLAIGAAVLAAAAMPLAVAGAEPGAGTSAAKVTAAKFKKLKQRVAQLEANGNGPKGPALGDLTGTYPAPEIAPGVVGSPEVTDESIVADDLAAGSVGTEEISIDSVGSLALALDSVGSTELKGLTARVGNGVGSNNNYVNASVTCAQGEMVIGGGYAWTNDADVTMVASAPDEVVENTTWVVRGKSPTSNTLFAWANCLAV